MCERYKGYLSQQEYVLTEVARRWLDVVLTFNPLTPTTLKYLCMNHGDQKGFSI